MRSKYQWFALLLVACSVPSSSVFPGLQAHAADAKKGASPDVRRAKINVSREDAANLSQVREARTQPLAVPVALRVLVDALEQENNPAAQKALIKGMLLGLEGRRNVPAPKNWQAVSDRLVANGDKELQRLAQNLSQVFGDEGATRAALATVQSRSESLEARRQALTSLLTQRRRELLPILEKLLDEEALQIEAIRGYSTFDAAHAPKLLLKRYPDFPPAAQRTVIETLATRKAYAEALFSALENKRLSREDIPVYVARSLSAMLGEKFSRTYASKTLSENKEALITKYTKMASKEALAKADAKKGREVYQGTCMACHKMYGEGGILGPDLTGSNRADLNYLLLNIIDPSGDIADAYKLVTVHTKSGQVLTGAVTAEDDQKLELSMVGVKNTIAKSDIKKRTVAPVSMMPEGLLEPLKPSDVLHLFKYMQTKTQVALP